MGPDPDCRSADPLAAGLARGLAPFGVPAVAALATIALPPEPASWSMVAAAVALTLGLALAAVLVPWRRLPVAAVLVVPLGYLVVIALLRDAQGGAVSGYASLAIVPVVWLALYGRPWMLVPALVGVALLFLTPLLLLGAEYPATEWRRAILSTVVAATAALAVQRLVSRNRAQARDVERERDFSDAVVDTAGMLVVVLDRGGRIRRWNAQCEWSTGYAAADVLGRRFFDFLIARDEADGVRETFGRLSAGDFPIVYENDWLARDGSRRRITWSNTALLDADGHPEHIVGIGLDVTEQRAIEQAVLRSEALMRGVMAAATEDTIIATDADGRVVLFNAGAERLLGYTAAEMLGRSIEVLHEPAELEARGRELGSDGGTTVLGHVPRRAGSERREWTYRRKDGTPFTVELTISAMRDDAGEVAGFIGLARDETERRAIEDSLRRSEQDLATVLAVAKELGRADDARAAVCDALERVTGAHMVRLFEPEDGHALVQTAARGHDLGAVRIPLDDAASGAVAAFRAGQRRFVPDTTGAGAQVSSALVAASGCRSLLFEPVLLAGEAVGVLVLGWREHRTTTVAPTVVHLLAAEAGRAIERDARYALLARQARTDELTALPNRRAWDEAVEREMSRARRTGRPLCMALLDLDHFKAYNDTHGHQAGDRLLKAAAAAWREVLRPGDLLARYGGEEFVAVLADCPPQEARAVAERLRRSTPSGETCSIGVATWDGAEAVDALVRRADEALYAAKRAGRDRVVAVG